MGHNCIQHLYSPSTSKRMAPTTRSPENALLVTIRERMSCTRCSGSSAEFESKL
jgi:hypothetical protein